MVGRTITGKCEFSIMKLTKKQQKEIEKLIQEITEHAKSVVDDYSKNPSKISGSVEIRIHEDSPWLDENKSFIPLTKKNKKD